MTRYPNNEQRGDQHIDRQPDVYDPIAHVETETMTDKSVAYNVILKVESQQEFVLACQTHGHADQLTKNLNACAWVQSRKEPKVCPVCEDSACEIKSMKCGRGG